MEEAAESLKAYSILYLHWYKNVVKSEFMSIFKCVNMNL